VALPVTWPRGPLHLVVDASGFKVYGEGERANGKCDNTARVNAAPGASCIWLHLAASGCIWLHLAASGCIWLHLGVDEKSGQIMAAKSSPNAVRDDAVLGDLLGQVPGAVQLAQVSGAVQLAQVSGAVQLAQVSGAGVRRWPLRQP